MRKLRKGTPPPEVWSASQLAEHQCIDLRKAKEIFDGYHAKYGGGYGDIEKTLILEYVEDLKREEQEREARYHADLATVQQVQELQKQIDVLKQMSASSSEDARKARKEARIANVIAIVATIIALLDLLFKNG